MTTHDPTGRPARGLDPRRSFSDADRRRIYTNQRGYCANCKGPVRLRDGSFHVHHVIPHHLHGATVIRNAVGLCQRCHRDLDHGTLVGPPPPAPREWQATHIPEAVDALAVGGSKFTVAAAPGAGKSLFAGIVADRLWDAGHIGRVVVVAPTGQLIDQWSDNLAYDARIWIDSAVKTVPSNMRHGYMGCAVTYASFAKASAVRDQIALANETPTLFIFDEVHHAADSLPWGTATDALVRQVPTARFMNLSGTLFRSEPGQRIAVVDYDRDPEGMLIARADVTIWADELIKRKELRDLELFEFDSEVRAVDLETGEIHDTELGVAGDNAEIHSALLSDDVWLREFFSRWLAHLDNQRFMLGQPFKGLVVAANQNLAERYRILLEDLLAPTGHDVWIAKSEDGPAARDALEDARTSPKAGVLVAVAMASEGYDNPDLTSIAYLSNVAAELRLAQIAGRVMRPTRHEKVNGLNLPGTVWLPAIPKLTEAWRSVLLNELHTVAPDDLVCSRCGREKPCGCQRETGSRVCVTCGLPKPCACDNLGKRTDPTHEYAFGESDLTGVYRNGVEVSVSAYEITVDILTATNKAEFVPWAIDFVDFVRDAQAAGHMTNLLTHIHKDPQP